MHIQNGWALKMILMRQQNWLTILELIQTMLKVFDDVENLINDISNNKVKKVGAIKRMKKKYIWLRTTKAKRKYCFPK